jgi:hypothetical protein
VSLHPVSLSPSSTTAPLALVSAVGFVSLDPSFVERSDGAAKTARSSWSGASRSTANPRSTNTAPSSRSARGVSIPVRPRTSRARTATVPRLPIDAASRRQRALSTVASAYPRRSLARRVYASPRTRSPSRPRATARPGASGVTRLATAAASRLAKGSSSPASSSRYTAFLLAAPTWGYRSILSNRLPVRQTDQAL